MTTESPLDRLAALRGVRAVAVVDASGEPRASAGRDEAAAADLRARVAAALAAAGTLGELFGGTEVRGATLESEGAALVLVALGASGGAQGRTCVALVDDLRAVGRVRAAIQRHAADLAEAVQR